MMLDNIQKQITEAMEAEVKQICEQEATAASARVYQRVREMHGRIATRLLSHTEFKTGTDHLIITVRFPKEQKGES